MAEAETEAKEETSKVTFIDAPGSNSTGFDAMFTPKNESKPNDFGFDDEGEYDEEEEEAPAPEQDTVLQDRIAALEATNKTLVDNFSKIQTGNQDTLIAELHTKYADAIKYGETEGAKALKAKLDEAYRVRGGANAAPQVEQNVTPTELQTKAKAWLGEQKWYGVDAAKTKKLQDVTSVLDASKFGSPELYIAEVERQVLGSQEGDKNEPIPNRVNPAPKSGLRGSPSSAPGTIKSIRELRGDRREAAETAIRVGGLAEKDYVANYNAIVKSSKARKSRRK